nr:MAG TPA: hypothetical protein [Caudoviricetes sp.]
MLAPTLSSTNSRPKRWPTRSSARPIDQFLHGDFKGFRQRHRGLRPCMEQDIRAIFQLLERHQRNARLFGKLLLGHAFLPADGAEPVRKVGIRIIFGAVPGIQSPKRGRFRPAALARRSNVKSSGLDIIQVKHRLDLPPQQFRAFGLGGLIPGHGRCGKLNPPRRCSDSLCFDLRLEFIPLLVNKLHFHIGSSFFRAFARPAGALFLRLYDLTVGIDIRYFVAIDNTGHKAFLTGGINFHRRIVQPIGLTAVHDGITLHQIILFAVQVLHFYFLHHLVFLFILCSLAQIYNTTILVVRQYYFTIFFKIFKKIKPPTKGGLLNLQMAFYCSPPPVHNVLHGSRADSELVGDLLIADAVEVFTFQRPAVALTAHPQFNDPLVILPPVLHGLALGLGAVGRRVCVAHGALAVAYALGGGVYHHAEDDQHPEDRVHHGQQLVAHVPKVNGKSQQRGNGLDDQQQRRDQGQPKGLVFQSYRPVDLHFFCSSLSNLFSLVSCASILWWADFALSSTFPTRTERLTISFRMARCSTRMSSTPLAIPLRVLLTSPCSDAPPLVSRRPVRISISRATIMAAKEMISLVVISFSPHFRQ